MALVVADRVQETTATTGTGTMTLAGAVAGFQTFAVIGNANTTYYTITSGNNWEVGIGTYTSSGTTLSRDTVLASSAGGTTKITLAGTSNVFCVYPAGKSFGLDQTLGVTNGGTGQTTYTDGQLLIGNTTGNTLTKATLTQGAGLTITNGSGSITAALNVANANTWTATQTFSGSTSVLASSVKNIVEPATVSATAATGTINYDVTTQSVLYYTTNASANFTVNFRASSGTSLNTAMATNDVVTVAFLVTNGATPYYNSAVQVDGNAVTPKWQAGTAPTSGNASSIDVYVYTIIKTGSAAFTILANQTQYK